jgi:hypothetical protein
LSAQELANIRHLIYCVIFEFEDLAHFPHFLPGPLRAPSSPGKDSPGADSGGLRSVWRQRGGKSEFLKKIMGYISGIDFMWEW